MDAFSFCFNLSVEAPPLVEAVQATFPLGEPMSQALGLSLADYRDYTEVVCGKAVREGLSVVTTGSRGEVLGFCINEDFATAPVYSLAAVNAKMVPLLKLLEQLDDLYSRKKPVQRGEVFHLYMLGVIQGFGGKGLGKMLIEKSVLLAREFGYRSVLAEATGLGSQHICRSLGFEERAAIEYATYEFHGARVFQGILGPTHCRLMELVFR